ncbi:MAG TPA: translation initiation factor IF-3 [Chloroflexota bacterium]|nr:translation initiation factor IF-3 [Chloroflexota bacterium]
MTRGGKQRPAEHPSEVWLFDEEGRDLGFVAAPDAMNLAAERELDLVRLDHMSSPPRFALAHAAARAADAARTARVAAGTAKPPKELRLRVATGAGDVETKRKQAEGLLAAGHRVKLRVELDPRKRSDPGPARALVEALIKSLAAVGAPEGKLFNEKGAVSVVVAPR